MKNNVFKYFKVTENNFIKLVVLKYFKFNFLEVVIC